MWFFSQEEKQLQQLVKDFTANEILPTAAKHDQDQTFNLEAFKHLGKLGLLGITADPEYGGSGLGALASSIVIDEISQACPSLALSYLAHSILCVNNIEQNASPEQKEKFLPKLISGEWVGCMGMSEPDFGSDALGLQTRALINESGSHYLVNGSKMWITNAQYADVAYVYVRTSEDGPKGISTFIVEKNSPGFSIGKSIHKMGMRASPTGELIFENAQVPTKNRVGNVGESYLHLLKNLEIERITISAISVGIAKACLKHSLKYARERKQFKKNLIEFQLIQKMLADMNAHTEMAASYLYQTAKSYDLGEKGPLAAASVKLAIPRMCTQIALDAIQLHGGYGYSSEFPLEKLMRDAKLIEIGAGTNEIMIKIIAQQLQKSLN
jgi:isovaleryl-CoA dehydrogenase